MSSKIDRLVNQVLNQVTDTNTVKGVVGDSTNNNRVPSVRQVIRFLKQGTNTWALGADLNRVYKNLRRTSIFRRVRRNNDRTDAIDINELVVAVNRLDTTTKRSVGQQIFYT